MQLLILAMLCFQQWVITETVASPEWAITDTVQKSGRYLVKFTATWCRPCIDWNANELPTIKAAGFTPVFVDSTHGNTWGVTSLPTFWIVDRATKKPVEKITGYTPATELLARLRDVSDPSAPAVVPQSAVMSHGDMVALHNRLHGGGSWNWPGDLATHLQTVHKVDTGKPSTSSPRIQQSACPGGNCPSPQNRAQRRGGFLRGLFR